MDLSLPEKLNEKLYRPAGPAGLELLVGLTMAAWTFCRVLLVHSSLASSYWVGTSKPMQYVQAIVFGLLVVSVACKGLTIKPTGIVLLFFLLLSSVSIWRLRGDLNPLVLTLFLVATRGMNMRRLARYYAAAIVCALIAATLLVCLMRVRDGAFSLKDALLLHYGFDEQYVMAIALFSILAASAMTIRGRRSKHILLVACVFCAIVAFVLLHARRIALFMLALAACVYLGKAKENDSSLYYCRREARVTLAALPCVLLCLSNDFATYYSIDVGRNGYVMLVSTFGYLFAACLCIMFARATIACPCEKSGQIVFLVVVLYVVLFAFETQPLYLEFNFPLLLLGLGFDRCDACEPKEDERLSQGGA